MWLICVTCKFGQFFSPYHSDNTSSRPFSHFQSLQKIRWKSDEGNGQCVCVCLCSYWGTKQQLSAEHTLYRLLTHTHAHHAHEHMRTDQLGSDAGFSVQHVSAFKMARHQLNQTGRLSQLTSEQHLTQNPTPRALLWVRKWKEHFNKIQKKLQVRAILRPIISCSSVCS